MPIHVDATGWRHMGQNRHAIVMKAHKWVTFTFIKNQNKAPFKGLLTGKNFHLVKDRGLPAVKIEVRIH